MKILNFGSLNYDYVYQVDHMVRPGETLASKQLQTFAGGKGLNQSIAIAKAGHDVYHAGLVGEDGQMLLNTCLDNGVNIDYIKQIEGKSGHTIIQIDKDAQNSILLYGGSNRMQTKEYAKSVISNFGHGDILLLQNEINELNYIVDEAYDAGMTIVLNPSPYDAAIEECDLSKISIFLMNEIEGEMMTGQKDVHAILHYMKEHFPNAEVVLTLGKNGSIYQKKECQCVQKSFPVVAVDTTAAGDTFTGYFLAGKAEGREIEEILERSAKASAIAVSREGAAASIPMVSEVEDREWK